MSFSADAITMTLLAVIAALVAGILAFFVAGRIKAARKQRDIVVIRATIIDYFRRSGVEVSADCTDPHGNDAFIAIIESEPMKRFRLSHIIEMTVREHVRKACGKELQKIYWRFPIKEVTQAAAGAANTSVPEENTAAVATGTKAPELSDEYINEGLEHYRHIPKPEVEELPWESFEQFANSDRVSPSAADSTPQTKS